MRVLFLIIIFIHGLIHILGFLKAFGIYQAKELTLPISKPLGVLWLITTALMLTYGLLHYFNSQYAWLVGLVALILSQVLIVCFWSDAKFATIPNVLILVVVVCTYGNVKFDSLVENEQKGILSTAKTQNIEIFSEAETKSLPKPVKKWLLKSGAVGRTKTQNGRIVQKAQMKMKPEQDHWYSANALQYTVINEPSFIWTVNLKMNSLLWFKGRDKFVDGKGEMMIKLNSLVNVVKESGERIDEGSLQRYLGEMVWFPSLAVSPFISWEEIDELSAKATMTYKNTKGSGTFFFTEDGDFIQFTAMRFQGNEPGGERKEWILTVDDYGIFDGIKVPSKMKASWKIGNDQWTWLKLELVELEYNIRADY